MGKMRWGFVLLAVLAGCSSSHRSVAPTTTTYASVQDRADAECRAAAKPNRFLNAQATTVGAMHAIQGGMDPPDHPMARVFKAEPDEAFAAWCWSEHGNYSLYVVGPGSPVVIYDNATNSSPPSPGPPVFG